MPTGRFICWCSRFLPCPKHSVSASESCRTISVLPESISVLPVAIGVFAAAVGRDAGQHLTTTCDHHSTSFRPFRRLTGFHSIRILTVLHFIHRPTSSHPIHPPTAFSGFQPISLRPCGQRFLDRRSRMQFVGLAPCDSGPTVGSILHAGLSAV